MFATLLVPKFGRLVFKGVTMHPRSEFVLLVIGLARLPWVRPTACPVSWHARARFTV
jgi:hypothetical protein